MGYRRLLTRGVITWAIVALAARVPVAMAPLAMVFLFRGEPGGYGLGSTLAAGYVVGEVVGAAALGTVLRPRRIRLQLAVGLAVGAGAFAGMAVLPPSAVVAEIALAFVAGAAPAANAGGMRSLLTDLVAEDDVPRALSADGVLTEIVWMAAPALVVFLALRVGGGSPLALAAVCAAAAAATMALVPSGDASVDADVEEQDRGAGWLKILLSAWPVYLTSAAIMSLSAVAELVLPALLEYRHVNVGLAGVLLPAFAVVSAVGAFCYGLRTWPGTVRAQSLAFLLAATASVVAVALLPGAVGIGVSFLAAGFFQSVVLVTRNLRVREVLPRRAHAGGYSFMYAVQGVGYSASAVLAGMLLAHATPRLAILSGAALTLLITVLGAVGDRRRPPTVVVTQPQAERVPG